MIKNLFLFIQSTECSICIHLFFKVLYQYKLTEREDSFFNLLSNTYTKYIHTHSGNLMIHYKTKQQEKKAFILLTKNNRQGPLHV